MSGSMSANGITVIAIAIPVAVLIGLLWGLLSRLYWERLAWKAVAFALIEPDQDGVQEWEIRAMAALLYESVPGWAKGMGHDWKFELLALSEWKKGAAWYAEHEPRLNVELFGETGPF